MAVKTALLESGPRPFSLSCLPPWGGLHDASTTELGANIVSDICILIETRVQLVAEKLTAPSWLLPVRTRRELRHTARRFGTALLLGLISTDGTRAVVIRSYTDHSACRLADSPEYSCLIILIPDFDY